MVEIDIVRSVVAEQVAPLVVLQDEIAEHSEARIDPTRSRERFAATVCQVNQWTMRGVRHGDERG